MPMSEQERRNAAGQPDAAIFGMADVQGDGQQQYRIAGPGQQLYGMVGAGQQPYGMAGAGQQPFGMVGLGQQPLGMMGGVQQQPFGYVGVGQQQPFRMQGFRQQQFGMAVGGQDNGQQQFDLASRLRQQQQGGAPPNPNPLQGLLAATQANYMGQGGNQGGANFGNLNQPNLTALQDMFCQPHMGVENPQTYTTEEVLKHLRNQPVQTMEEMKAENDRRHAETLKELTIRKKAWRKKEREEQAKLDARPRQEPTPIMKILFGRRGYRPMVRKKEFPWWIEESYRVPSDSETEERWAREEEECRRTGRPRFLPAPCGLEAYESWRNRVSHLSADESEIRAREISGSDVEEEEIVLSDSEINSGDNDANVIYELYDDKAIQNWKKIDIQELWVECGMSEERIEKLDENNLEEEIARFIAELRGPPPPDGVPIGCPIEMWTTIGLRNKRMFKEAKRQLQRYKRRRRRERVRAQGIFESSTSEDENAVVELGGLGDPAKLDEPEQPKKIKWIGLRRKKKESRDTDANTAQNETNNRQQRGSVGDSNITGFRHECFDTGYDADTGESSDDSESDMDDEPFQMGGMGDV